MAFSLAESFLGRILFRIEDKGKGRRASDPPLGRQDSTSGKRAIKAVLYKGVHNIDPNAPGL
jgi:anti-sigma regulatory factor (Ser/Thr protein kinase)